MARRWAAVEHTARGGLRAGAIAGPLMRAGSAAARSLFSDELVPSWPREMPPPAPAKLPRTSREGAAAVYMPACVNRIFGPPAERRRPVPLPEAMVAVSAQGRHAGLDSRRRRRQLLLGPLDLQGLHGGRGADGKPHDRRRSGGGAGRASCRS